MKCDCGLAEEDPFHRGWHNIASWNNYIFDLHRQKMEKLFDKTYESEIRPSRPETSEEIPF